MKGKCEISGVYLVARRNCNRETTMLGGFAGINNTTKDMKLRIIKLTLFDEWGELSKEQWGEQLSLSFMVIRQYQVG